MLVILSYIFYFIAATASPLQRRWLAKHKNTDTSGQVHFAFQVSTITVLLSLLLLMIKPPELGGDWVMIGSLALISGVFSAGFAIASYISQKHVEAGVGTLIVNINTPVAIILASLFLSEHLTLQQVFGTALLLTAVLIVSHKHHLGRFRFDRYFLLLLAGGVMLGVSLYAERALQKQVGFTTASILSWTAQAICLWVATILTRSKSTYSSKDIIITGTLRFFQLLSWVTLTYIVGNLSLVASITTFKIVIMFVAGAVILGERDSIKRKIIGSVIACLGLLLMR